MKSVTINDLGFSIATICCLRHAGIETPEQLAEIARTNSSLLLKIPNVGKARFKEIMLGARVAQDALSSAEEKPKRLCKYLTGENIAPRTKAEAVALIGKRVRYLQSGDIDRSGRGYFFPCYGTIAGAAGREVAIDHPANFVIHLSSLVEMIELETPHAHP